MSKRERVTAAVITAAAVAWILYPRPVFTALVLLAFLACCAVTALAIYAAATKGRRS